MSLAGPLIALLLCWGTIVGLMLRREVRFDYLGSAPTQSDDLLLDVVFRSPDILILRDRYECFSFETFRISKRDEGAAIDVGSGGLFKLDTSRIPVEDGDCLNSLEGPVKDGRCLNCLAGPGSVAVSPDLERIAWVRSSLSSAAAPPASHEVFVADLESGAIAPGFPLPINFGKCDAGLTWLEDSRLSVIDAQHRAIVFEIGRPNDQDAINLGDCPELFEVRDGTAFYGLKKKGQIGAARSGWYIGTRLATRVEFNDKPEAVEITAMTSTSSGVVAVATATGWVRFFRLKDRDWILAGEPVKLPGAARALLAMEDSTLLAGGDDGLFRLPAVRPGASQTTGRLTRVESVAGIRQLRKEGNLLVAATDRSFSVHRVEKRWILRDRTLFLALLALSLALVNFATNLLRRRAAQPSS